YTKYEKTPKLARKVIKAQKLWFAILESQIETGTPYMLYKDACIFSFVLFHFFVVKKSPKLFFLSLLGNRKSNQQNLGTIKSSNLCCEVVEYTAPDEVAVCNLASICLSRFVDRKNGLFDFTKLYQVTRVVTRNLNKIIDVN